MGVQFEHPLFLLLLIAVAAFAVYAFRSDFRLSGARRKWAIGLRIMIAILLVLVMSGFHTFRMVYDKEMVFVVDRSASMPEDAQALGWMNEAVQGKNPRDKLGIVGSGLDAAVEKSLDSVWSANTGSKVAINPQYTNLEKGLQLASSLFSGHGGGRIVLISDGEENVGDVSSAALLLRERGITLDVLSSERKPIQDVAIESLKMPDKLYQAESFSFEVKVQSTFAGEGELRLYEDNEEIGRTKLTLERGENRVALQGLARNTGMHRYRAEVFASGDEQAANNVSYAFTRVTGSPKVLIVEGEANTSTNLENSLKSSLINYEVTAPGMLPIELAKYAGYDSIIFNNVSGEQVGGTQMELIEQAVRSYGIGFMMVGGEDSFGMGGYFKTPIEKLLPVSMELEGKREVPSLGLILVIDRSGSMEGDKLKLAKESAMRTVELLRAKDTVGVLAFDDQPWWVVEPQVLSDKDYVLSQINSIPSAGGTDIYPAVADATKKMLDVEAQRKHIILLTDGQSAGSSGYNDLLNTMLEEKITMSTVAVGEDADVQLLQSLADGAKGRYYYVQDATTLPAIFSREAAMISRTYVVNKPFVPALVQPGDWQSLFADGLPQIYGYVAATPKTTAQTVLSSPEPDPLLARWQYGSGRTVAWTSDMTGKWSRDWVGWSRFAEIFAEMVKWTLPQFTASDYAVQTTVEGNEVRFEVHADDEALPGKLDAVISSETVPEQRVPLLQTSPGIYTGSLEVSDPGSFLVQLQGEEDGDGLRPNYGSGSGFVVPYSPEYSLASGNPPDKLAALAELSGGRVLSWDKPGEVLKYRAAGYAEPHDWERPLLIAALLLWLADIAVRRMSLPWGRIAERLRPWGRRAGTRAAAAQSGPPAAVPDAGLARLAARKSRAAAFYGAGGGDREDRPAAAPAAPPHAKRGGQEPARSAPRAEAPASPPQEEAGRPQAGAGEAAPAGDALGRLLAAKQRGKR
ncbi:VWA domain-containing protein [Paenibacillus motobuensis]|uniref:VWA domain-containing protein n=1 Tax=Paenibacillus TaxID=44249 RepID=UPI002041978E|nr:VWA domain-containing protein [Paenibacillus lutimineralis]MCM3646132.1 VWA domain-containing protein [Paenibacillus motobuensis]